MRPDRPGRIQRLMQLLAWLAVASAAALRTPYRSGLRSLRCSAGALAPDCAQPVIAGSSVAAEKLIPFVPSFKAAYRARAVVRQGRVGVSDASYNLSMQVPRVEVTAMLHGLSHTEQFEAATELLSAHFERTRHKRHGDERLASIVLNSCADHGRMDICNRVVAHMRKGSVPMSELTFCILIKGHGRAGNVAKVASTYELMRAERVDPDLATFNALLDAYARNGQMSKAEAVLEHMQQEGLLASARSYNTLVKGYSRLGQLHRAFAMVRQMRRALGAKAPNQVTYNTLLSACVRCGQVSRAAWILSGMRRGQRRGLHVDVWSYTTLLRGLLEDVAAPLEQAVVLLRQMGAEGVRPNAVTATTLLNACFDRGNASAAKAVAAELEAIAVADPVLRHAVECAFIVGLCRPSTDALGEMHRSRPMVAEGLRRFALLARQGETGAERSASDARPGEMRRPPVRVCNALLAALTAAEMNGQMEGAGRVFALMQSGSAAPPDRYSLSLMLGGYARSRQISEALPIWQQLERRGWCDVIALNSWLQVCVRSGHLRLALQSFQNAKTDSKQLASNFDLVTFATLINALVARSLPAADARALRLWAEMRRARIVPDHQLVSAMLRACRNSLGVEVALRIRLDLIALGWSRRQLASHDAVISELLPTLSEIMTEPTRWAALGVRADSTLTSEAGTLRPRPRAERPAVAAASLGGRQGWDQRVSRGRGQRTPSPAQFELSPSSEEIFERKGWNKMDGSWRPF